jgi:hypothetical protein
LLCKVWREGDAPGQRLDALALAVGQEALKVDAGPARRLGLREVGGEVRGVLAESLQNRRIELRGNGLHDPLEGPNPFHASPF